MRGKKEEEGQPPKLTGQQSTGHHEGASQAVRLQEESRGYDRRHEDLVAAFREFVHERQEHFRRAGAPVDTPEGFIREKLETETRTWGLRWEDHKSQFWVPILTAWDALTYHRHRTGSEHEQEAGYQLWQHFQETHQPAVQLFHPVQIRVIDALTEAIGIKHQRGQTAIPIPERIRTITDYNAWLLSDEYHDLRRQAGWRPREQPGTRQRVF